MRPVKVSCPWCVAFGFAVVTIAVLVRRSQTFRYFFRLTTYYVLMSIVCALACVPSVFRPFNPANMLIISFGLKRLRWTIGVEAVLRHEERIPKDRRFIMVVNHQSSLDVFGLMHVWQEFHPCLPVMKRELLYTGPLGVACYLAGCVFIDRRNAQQSHRALNERLEDIKNGKASFMLFPEGTRNPEPKMLPFKKGAFHMAVDCQAPVVPVVLSNYKSFFCYKDRIFNDGVIKLTVLPVVSTDGLTTNDVSDLTKRVQSLMQDELDRQLSEVEETQQMVPLATGVQRAVVSDIHFVSSASNESALATKERPRDARRTNRLKRST
ncbi:1-acyl-sn-glycerol-3-phosphate acyltransferase alpha [Rhipicephalus sanguineus]|uniref:1-acyl-sn-glycerol-3-phosphate acyltransferase alpha n=1 Tax=Rhipicephalus sanguineus TaxID=34632 RepID=UPI0018934E82|nr:1-acyl-sn-glycerol-3-phosphate acyltransferase alpha [Rhipicephalus sanguineus]